MRRHRDRSTGLLPGIVEDDVAAEDMPIELFDAVLAVNLRGLFLVARPLGASCWREVGKHCQHCLDVR